MNIQYQEHDIHEVFRYFVAGFETTGEKPWDWKAHYDPRTGKVIFKLYWPSKEDQAPGSLEQAKTNL